MNYFFLAIYINWRIRLNLIYSTVAYVILQQLSPYTDAAYVIHEVSLENILCQCARVEIDCVEKVKRCFEDRKYIASLIHVCFI